MKKLLLLTLFIIPFSMSYAENKTGFCNPDRGAPQDKVDNGLEPDGELEVAPTATGESCPAGKKPDPVTGECV